MLTHWPRRGFWIRFVAACLIVVVGESIVHKAIADATGQPPFLDTFAAATGLYQRVVSAPRPPRVRFTSIVEINSQSDTKGISALNVCRQRSFLSVLLRRIDELNPRVIVIDKYFSRDACLDDQAGTTDLQETIAEIRSRRPVLVGARLVRIADQKDGVPATHRVEETLAFAEFTASSQTAVLQAAPDNRRVPLQWTAYPPGSGPSATFDALALASSKFAYPHLVSSSRTIQYLLSNGLHPFAALLGPSDYAEHHLFASEILCGQRISPGEDWRLCARALPNSEAIFGRVVIVGENIEQMDQHYTVVGRIPGFYLQASYIEAILDDRLYKPTGWIPDIASSLIFLLLLEVALAIGHGSFWKSTAGVAAVAAVMAGLMYLLIMHTGYYFDPFLITGIAMAMKALHPLYALAKR